MIKIPSTTPGIGAICYHDKNHILDVGYNVWKCTKCIEYYVCNPRGCIG